MPGNIRTIPPSVIKSWPTPNYVDPVQRPWFPVYSGTLQAVVTVMVLTRLSLRAAKKAGGLGLDDAFLAVSYVLASVLTAVGIYECTKLGLDRHTWDVPPDSFESTVFFTFIDTIAFFVSGGCVKVSVLLFYRRMTKGTYDRRWRYAIYAAIAFTIACSTTFTLALVADCQPLDAYWKAFSPTYQEKYYCADIQPLNVVSGLMSAFTDAYSVFLPMMITRKCVINKRKRLALNIVFSLGFLVIVAGCVRTYYCFEFGKTYDVTWAGFDLLVWAVLELDVALICASAPALRVLFRDHLRQPISRMMDNSGSHNHSALSPMGRRNTEQTDNLGTVNYFPYSRDNSPDRQVEMDKALIRHSINGSLEAGTESRPSMWPNDLRTSPKHPVEVGGYALTDLNKRRRRPGSQEYATDALDAETPAVEPVTTWYEVPCSSVGHGC